MGADKASSSGPSGGSGVKTEATGFDISKCPEQGEMNEQCRLAREAEAKAKAEKEKLAPKPGGGY